MIYSNLKKLKSSVMNHMRITFAFAVSTGASPISALEWCQIDTNNGLYSEVYYQNSKLPLERSQSDVRKGTHMVH